MFILTSDVVSVSIFEKIDTALSNLFVRGTKTGIISILIYLIIGILVNRFLSKVIEKTTWKQKELIAKGFEIAVNVLIGIGILYQFSFMSSLMTALLASGGVVAVVVGLVSQEAASNIVAGMMIFWAKPFNIGDTIVLKEYNLRGTVKDIKINHTVIETLDMNPIMIPNTIMNKAIIENITQETDFKATYLYVDIAYESDIDQAISIMQEVIANHPLFYDPSNGKNEKKVPIHCMEFKDSGISLRAKVTTRTAAEGFELSSDCRIAIKKAFDKNGIEIPYPHIQVKQ